MTLPASPYRADVDGLRAVAVIVVVLFHTGLAFPGGFVGVDVFFVISGYLITQRIAADLDRGTFSLARFWDRRIRRIWPAALVVTIATLVAGWFLMLPRDYRSLADDALAQVAMIANFRYWLSVFYFGIASEVRPLLHTWSLAVEEQFYLVYPVVMLVAWQAGRRWCAVILAAIAAASLLASIVLLENRGSFVFYMLPFRAWEMILGGLLALAASTRDHSRWVTESVGLIGGMLVVLPAMLYGRQTPFPGLSAVPPCLGAVMIIAAGAGRLGSVINRLLATPPLRAIGLVSYSLYLWHWPVLALLRYHGSGEIVTRRLPLVLLAIGGLTLLSWRFVEQPFRRPAKASEAFSRTAMAAGFVSLLLAAVCFWIRRTDGVPTRFSPAVLRLLADADDSGYRDRFSRRSEEGVFPLIGREAAGSRRCLFIWGDSHALALGPVVDSLAREMGIDGEIACQNGVPPLPDVWKPHATFNRVAGKRLAEAWPQEVVERIRTCRPRHVVLCARWSSYLRAGDSSLEDNTIATLDSDDTSASNALVAMTTGLHSIQQVCAETGSELWFLLEVPDQASAGHGSIQQRALAWHWTGKAPSLVGVSRESHDEQQRAVHAAVFADGAPGMHVVDLAEPFFGTDGMSRVGDQDSLWYADTNHVSARGADEVLGSLLRDMLTQITTTCAGEDPITPEDGAAPRP